MGLFGRKNKVDKVYDIDSPSVGKDYVNEAVKFFNVYLTFCNNHNVVGIASLLKQTSDNFSIGSKVSCQIFSIDGEHAADSLEIAKMAYNMAVQKKIDAGDYLDASAAGEDYLKFYFDCKELHYAFSDVDEYQFGDSDVIISYERTLFTHGGAEWIPTLSVIKQELIKIWPDAVIDIEKSGLVIK